MGCHILEGKEGNAVFYCSTTGWAFGPLMGNADEAEAFLKYLAPMDPRNLKDSELEGQYADFVLGNVCECGTLRDEYDRSKRLGAEGLTECKCLNEGDGECSYCKGMAALEAWKPEAGDRFVCFACERREKKGGVLA
jgi:hypothetical protein